MSKAQLNSEFSPSRNNNLYLYTKGGQFSLNGKNYIGEYHYVGTIAKTGPKPGPDAQVLHRIYTNQDHYIYDKLLKFNVPVLGFVDPIPYLYVPDEQAYVVGFDTRYFVEKFDDPQSYAIEINQDQYNNINQKGGIDGGLYKSVRLKWKLVGLQADIKQHNELEIYKATTQIPTIGYSIKNYLEFARVTSV